MVPARRCSRPMSPNGVTPEEHELPDMISVDDHVMEPKELWQEQLPESLRERGPKVLREKVKLSFKGGHYGFERNADDGEWCDVWVYEDLVMPTGLLHAPAGVPRDQQRNVAATYEDFRPGTWDQAERLADMTLNHVRSGDQLPQHLPPLRRPGLPRAGRQGPRPHLPAHLQRLDDRRLVRRRRQGPSHPAHPRAAVEPGARRRGGAPLRRQGQLRHRLQREPVEARRARRCTPASGTCCGRPASRPARRCRCTSARRRACRRPPTTRRSPRRCRSTPRTPRARSATGSSPARSSASPTSPSPTPRARSAGCRSSSSAWTPSGATAAAASTTSPSPRASRSTAGSTAASSTTCTA